ncbi:MAG: hypothetical protein KA010_00955 [Saprospiraceae bacterium]|nr:hypothetical protein [Saprospiraceae bacterium]
MSTNDQTANKGKYWAIFFISTIVMIALLIFLPEWFWVALPFVCTYLALALGVI